MANRIDEIRARLASATQGEWKASSRTDAVIVARPDITPNEQGNGLAMECHYYGGELLAESMTKPNAEFVAAAPADLRWLLEQVANLSRRVSFRAGDAVFHRPSGEEWCVAALSEDGKEFLACGWPETLAKVADAFLVEACDDAEHERTLRSVAASRNDDGQSSYRSRCAARNLAALEAARAQS